MKFFIKNKIIFVLCKEFLVIGFLKIFFLLFKFISKKLTNNRVAIFFYFVVPNLKKFTFLLSTPWRLSSNIFNETLLFLFCTLEDVTTFFGIWFLKVWTLKFWGKCSIIQNSCTLCSIYTMYIYHLCIYTTFCNNQQIGFQEKAFWITNGNLPC